MSVTRYCVVNSCKYFRAFEVQRIAKYICSGIAESNTKNLSVKNSLILAN